MMHWSGIDGWSCSLAGVQQRANETEISPAMMATKVRVGLYKSASEHG